MGVMKGTLCAAFGAATCVLSWVPAGVELDAVGFLSSSSSSSWSLLRKFKAFFLSSSSSVSSSSVFLPLESSIQSCGGTQSSGTLYGVPPTV